MMNSPNVMPVGEAELHYVYYCSFGDFLGPDHEAGKAHCRKENKHMVELEMPFRHRLRIYGTYWKNKGEAINSP